MLYRCSLLVIRAYIHPSRIILHYIYIKPIARKTMPHSVFIRHTYIYKCSSKSCNGEWKINEAADSETLNCPHCGKRDSVHHVLKDQRDKARNRYT